MRTVTPNSPALQAPPLNRAPGAEYAATTRRFQGIPTIEQTSRSRLWAAWYAGGPDEPTEGPGNYVLLASSSDGGETWDSPHLVVDPPGAVRAFDPCQWLDPTGVLWLFWAQSEGLFDGRAGLWATTAADPDSASPRWSEPRRISDGIMMNKPTVLKNGQWLLPVAFWQQGQHYEARSGSHVLLSADDGKHFELILGPQVPQVTFDEHMVVERQDSSLWMLIRTKYGIAESTSKDGGLNWSEPRPSRLTNVDSRFFIRRLSSGNLLLVAHQFQGDDKVTRSHLTARISTDDGHTWSSGLLLDERKGVSYPDGVQDEDGTISIIYDFQRQAARQILLVRFQEAEALAAHQSGQPTVLMPSRRQVVDQAGGSWVA